MKYLALIALCAALAGCVSDAEREAHFRRQCLSFGAVPGSPAYVQCMATLTTGDAQRRAINGGILADTTLLN